MPAFLLKSTQIKKESMEKRKKLYRSNFQAAKFNSIKSIEHKNFLNINLMLYHICIDIKLHNHFHGWYMISIKSNILRSFFQFEWFSLNEISFIEFLLKNLHYYIYVHIIYGLYYVLCYIWMWCSFLSQKF